MPEWRIESDAGELSVLTDVTGRAARLGHRLTIRMDDWSIRVGFTRGVPRTAEVSISVAGLQVVSGVGGVKGLSAPERAVARSNALGALDPDNFPLITFTSEDIEPNDGGFTLRGTAEIHGVRRPLDVPVRVPATGSPRAISTRFDLRQSDFGVRPFSLMMGSLSVADEVGIRFEASVIPPQ